MGDGQFIALCVGVFLTALFAFLSWAAIFWGNIDRSNLLKELKTELLNMRRNQPDAWSVTAVEKYELSMIRRQSIAALEEVGRLSARVEQLDKDMVRIWKTNPPPIQVEPKPLTYADILRFRITMEDKQ